MDTLTAVPVPLWDQISAIGSAAGSIVAAIGLLLVARQIQLQRGDGELQAITLLLSELNTPEMRKAQRLIYSRQPSQLVLASLSEDAERNQVELVIAHLDRLGFRVRERQVNLEHAYRLFWDTVIRSAQQLGDHLDDQSRLRGYEHCPDFQWLARAFKTKHLRSKSKLPPHHRKLALPALLKTEPLAIFPRFPPDA